MGKERMVEKHEGGKISRTWWLMEGGRGAKEGRLILVISRFLVMVDLALK